MYYVTRRSSYKVTDEATLFIIERFYMFAIKVWYDNDGDPYDISIKCNNCDKVISNKWQDE